MDVQTALLLSAVETCAAIDRVEAEAEAKVVTLEDLWAVRDASLKNFRDGHLGIMARLADAAFRGDAFATAWITEAFGDHAHDQAGEEFGGYRTLPDRATIDARIAAVPANLARATLRSLAAQ
jgi:hypothetical protein